MVQNLVYSSAALYETKVLILCYLWVYLFIIFKHLIAFVIDKIFQLHIFIINEALFKNLKVLDIHCWASLYRTCVTQSIYYLIYGMYIRIVHTCNQEITLVKAIFHRSSPIVKIHVNIWGKCNWVFTHYLL